MIGMTINPCKMSERIAFVAVTPSVTGGGIVIVSFLRLLCGSSITHDHLNVAVQDLQQREKLIERLSVVRLIKEPIELSRRRAKPTNDLSR